MKHVKLFEQFIAEAVSPDMVIIVKGEDDKMGRWNIGNKQLINALRKTVSDLGKKALDRAYTDDADIVNNKTSKTMVRVTPGMTVAQAAEAINAWAEENKDVVNPPKMNKSVSDADLIEIKSDTRAIVACSMRDAKRIYDEVHNSKAKIKVRIMERKDGAKVYIDTADRAGLDTAIEQVNALGIKK